MAVVCVGSFGSSLQDDLEYQLSVPICVLFESDPSTAYSRKFMRRRTMLTGLLVPIPGASRSKAPRNCELSSRLAGAELSAPCDGGVTVVEPPEPLDWLSVTTLRRSMTAPE